MHIVRDWWERSCGWLDDRGRPAWIIVMVAGFIFFWPIGLAILFYTIWSNRMSCNSWGRRGFKARTPVTKTGNTAFDTYREETLKRLDEERLAFTGFLEQLRSAKDKAEFDQFMASRQQMI